LHGGFAHVLQRLLVNVVYETRHRAKPRASRGTQPVHPGYHAVGSTLLADEQGLEHAELADRLLELLHVRRILIWRRLDVGHSNFFHRPERGVAHQLLDVVPAVPHAKGGRQAFPPARPRLLFFGIDLRLD
jgi:hypothetical protein